MAQNPRPPYRPSSNPGRPVPPQAPGPDLPRSGAARRPGGARPPVAGGPRRASGSVRSTGSGRPSGSVASAGRPTRVADAAPTEAVGRTTVATTVAEPEKKKDLTVNKILAGAGAAATSAVFGSYFGAAGTVAGAALGSVVTTLATTMYQRSLDRTREIALQRVRLPGRGDTKVLAEPVDPLATIPLQRGSAESPMLEPVLPAAPKRARWTRKRVIVAAAGTVAAFLIGLLAITGVEWLKGSPISGGESGTSVSRVVTGGAADTGTSGTEESTTPTTTEQAPEERSPAGGGAGEGSASPTTSPAPSSSAPPTTTSRAPSSAGQDGVDQNGVGLGGVGLGGVGQSGGGQSSGGQSSAG